MPNIRHQKFRSFLTERFTTVAVEIFAEVETIVEAYYEENKRLRNMLHMVLSPEIKLPRIDVSGYTRATTDVRAQPPELNTGVDLEISEPLPKKPKEEQIEYDISSESEQQQQQQKQQQQQQQGLGATDNFITPDCVKNDPDEEDSSMPCIADSYHIKVVEFNPDSSATLSADEANYEHEDFFSSDSDCPQLSRSEESTSKSQEAEKHNRKSMKKKKSKRFLQKTMLELPRMMPYKSFIAAPTDCQSLLARLTEAFKNVPDNKKPLITKMGLKDDVELVDCAFGKVPKGCPLSYQCPVPSSQDYKMNDNAPLRPLLPLSSHTLEPMSALPTLSAKEQDHVNVMQITWEAAHSLEHSTCRHKELVEELRKLRLTSRFKEICKLKPVRSHAEHLIFKIEKGFPRCKMAQIEEEMKSEALREYCRQLCVNWSPCGLVVHPNAPWLGAQPDGLVYDPSEMSSFGLVHVKCIRFRSFVDCGFMFCQDGVLQLKKTHSYYWHIQGEMMVTGTSWCDLLVYSREDILVQRIYRDKVIINVMKKKLADFFFQYYLPSLVSN
ncbi:uncharacterized protein LOC122868451 [Siniperca chuatsi]|uniref:uncharacterized protein LOC122868451 n=1 Tax=Siniperca chuatsi TaxID=119488 RepID=UPI001CE1A72C|nr:uncharacterized protein LOC122868451 [Siniperca chuatsi]